MPKVKTKADGPLARHLRELRGERSLRDVAGEAGIAFSYLHRLERGVILAPSPPVLERLAKALDADYVELLTDAGYL